MEVIKGATNGTAFKFVVPLIDSSSRPSYKAAPTLVAGDVKIARYTSSAWSVANITSLPAAITGLTTHLEVSLTAAEMTADDDSRPIIISFKDAAGSEWDDQTVEIRLGTMNSNLQKINGELTSGNNATLRLKTLDIRNSSGDALYCEGSNRAIVGIGGTSGTSAGFYLEGDIGLKIAADTDEGISVTTNGTNKDAVKLNGNGSGSGLDIAGGATGNGVTIAGGSTEGKGIEVSTSSGEGLQIAAQGGAAAQFSGTTGLALFGDGYVGLEIAAQSGNHDAVDIRGNGSGVGLKILGGGGGTTGNAVELLGDTGLKIEGATYGMYVEGTDGTGPAAYFQGNDNQDGISAQGGDNGGSGIEAGGNGGGHGIRLSGSVGGHGLYAIGGSTSGVGIRAQGGTNGGEGIKVTATGGNTAGIRSTGSGNGSGMTLESDVAGVGSGLQVASYNSAGMTISSGATDAVRFIAAGAAGIGLKITGSGTGSGIEITAGATGSGILSKGGGTSGAGIRAEGQVDSAGVEIVGEGNGDALSISADSGNAISAQTSGNYGMNLGGNLAGLYCGGNVGAWLRGTAGPALYALSTGDAEVGDGSGILAIGHSNYPGIAGQGTGSGAGMLLTGGATGAGLEALGGSTSGDGINSEAQTSGHGLRVAGADAGEGLRALGGATGNGAALTGGSTSGHGITIAASADGDGVRMLGAGLSRSGLVCEGDNGGNAVEFTGDGAGNGLRLVAGSTGNGLSASGGSVSGHGIVAAAANDGDGLRCLGDGTGKDLSADQIGTPVNLGNGASLADNLSDLASTAAGAGTYDRSTDSLEAIRNRGDAAWTTGGGSGLTQQEVRDAMLLAPTGVTASDSIDDKLDDLELQVDGVDTDLTSVKATVDANLDVAVSTRSDFNEAVDSVTVGTNNDKTGYSISGTKTTLDALNDVSAADVDTELTTNHGSGSWQTAALSGVADAVWDALVSSYADPGSFGELMAAIKTVVDNNNGELVDGTYGLNEIKLAVDAIVGKLPSGTISNFSLTDVVDTVTVESILEIIVAMANGRFRIDYPSSGQITFYKRDNATLLFTVNVTDTERTRV